MPYFPWAQLTFLNLPNGCLDSKDAFTILSLCSSLVKCKLGLIPDEESGTLVAGRPYIALPSLETLQIEMIQLGTHSVLKQLTLPRLARFNLDDEEGGRDTPWVPAYAPAITCSRMLQQFIARSVSFPHGTLEALLEAAPVLIELDIRYHGILTDTTRTRIASGELVPRLALLRCAAADISELAPFLDMVERRNAEGVTREILGFAELFIQNEGSANVDDDVYDANYERLDKHQERGWKTMVRLPREYPLESDSESEV